MQDPGGEDAERERGGHTRRPEPRQQLLAALRARAGAGGRGRELIAQTGEIRGERVVHLSGLWPQGPGRVQGLLPRGQSLPTTERSASSRSGCTWRYPSSSVRVGTAFCPLVTISDM